jgi:hypothetical protein
MAEIQAVKNIVLFLVTHSLKNVIASSSNEDKEK